MREKSMAPKGIAAALATAAIGMTHVALAQGYPERTVEITVPSSPGATADLLGRVLADGLTQQLGRRFIIVNKAAA
jgi:tripartite-type tricarboxylate transporter receptor subunit TctC